MITGTRTHGIKRRLLPESGNKSYVKDKPTDREKNSALLSLVWVLRLYELLKQGTRNFVFPVPDLASSQQER